MGSIFEHISIEKAAEALSISRRMVYYRIKKGSLRTVKNGQKQLVLRRDVTQILEERKIHQITVTVSKKTVQSHERRIHMLENQVRLLMRMQDLFNEPLTLSAIELKNFHEQAEYCLKESWSPQQEHMWKDFFIRLRIEDLEKLGPVLFVAEPWLVFHSLCKAIMEAPHDLELVLQFSAGKTNLERIAYVWATANKKNSKELDKIIKTDQKQVNKVVRRVRRKRAKN